jgi:C-terminal processing protease CtpA/Prc
MYNQFVSSYEDELNDVFANFKSESITELVLDLRYNRGGSINNCIILSSLITGQFTGEVFSKQNWNTKLNSYWEDKNEDLNDYFVGSLSSGAALNSLNLQKIYVLTSSESASASELLINGLASHIEVILIGDKTTGKNVGSITIYDYIDNDGNKNPNHKYAMQPIVLAIANSNGFSDYTDGLKPNYEVKESVSQMGILGNTQEGLLSKAIQVINGTDLSRSSIRQDNLIENRLIDPEMLKEQKLIIEIPDFKVLKN